MKNVGKVKSYIILASVVCSLSGCAGSMSKDRITQPQQEAEMQEISEQETVQSLPTGQSALLAREALPHFTKDNIRMLSLEKEGAEYFRIAYEPKEYKSKFDYWTISVPYQSLVTVNTESMYQLYSVLEGLVFTPSKEQPDAGQSGITPNSERITVQYMPESGDGVNEAVILIGSKDGQGNYYAELEGYEEQVYTLPESVVEALTQLNPFDYILRVVSLIHIDTVSKVQVKAGGRELALERGGEGCQIDGHAVEDKQYQELYSLLLSPYIREELTDMPQGALEESVLSLRFIRTESSMPEMVIDYYPCNEELMRVKVNGVEQFLVDKTDVDAILTKIQE